MLNTKKNNIYKYHIKNLKIFAYHGLYDKEIKNGQTFKLNVIYKTCYDINKIHKDDIENIVDYIDVIKEINIFFQEKRYNLMELLINDLYIHLNKKFDFYELKIDISKQDNKYLKNIKYKEISIGNE